MKISNSFLATFALFMFLGTSVDGNANEAPKSPYAGQQNRQIKSLSSKDIDDLLNGRGWGFAKAAELNGMPEPAHILEFGEKINLNDAQKAKILSLFKQMKASAIKLGTKMVQAEQELDQMFANKSITQKKLEIQLDKIALVRSKLRQVHLETHLQTPEILSRHQIVTYNQLRGYANKSGHSGHH